MSFWSGFRLWVTSSISGSALNFHPPTPANDATLPNVGRGRGMGAGDGVNQKVIDVALRRISLGLFLFLAVLRDARIACMNFYSLLARLSCTIRDIPQPWAAPSDCRIRPALLSASRSEASPIGFLPMCS